MLVDQYNAHVLALLGESFKGRLDGLRVRLVVDDEKVLLAVAAGSDVL